MIREKGYLYNYNLIKVLLRKCVRRGGRIQIYEGCLVKVKNLLLKLQI
jgi:hypothetical protein